MSDLRLRFGRLEKVLAERPGATEWEVAVDGEEKARAISYAGLTEELAPGDPVVLNTAAVALGLGTGGLHFVVARLGRRLPFEGFSGPDAGHLLKLRYTPLQHRVLCVEDDASPHREAILGFRSLEGTPVVCAELHSQMAAAAIAAHNAAPELRLVYVMTDSAALPIAFSRIATALREQGVLAATVTAGQAFGGDYEAVNLHTALIAARAVARADAMYVAQGPGNAGTGTEYGFSGLTLLEALHAAEALGGRPSLVARLSEAETRERHQGISHHTATLARLVRCEVEIPVPASEDEGRMMNDEGRRTDGNVEPSADAPRPSPFVLRPLDARHSMPVVEAARAWPALAAFRPALTSMGRGIEEDRVFWLAAAAAGLRAVELRYRDVAIDGPREGEGAAAGSRRPAASDQPSRHRI